MLNAWSISALCVAMVGGYLLLTSPGRKGLFDHEDREVVRGGSPTLQGQVGCAFLLIALVLFAVALFQK